MQFTFEHLGLPARDPGALKDWYVRTLGGKLVLTGGTTAPVYFVQLSGMIFEIYQATRSLPDTADNKLAGLRHLALRVDSIEAAKAELELRGVKFTAAIGNAGGGGRVLFFEDAEGNLLHLVERPVGFAFY